VLRAEDIDWNVFGTVRSLGITAGASAPEVLVEEIIDAFAERFSVNVESMSTADESVFFPLPRELREQAAE
jgi:4-hydroxy-3-methylbut-2-enyl diphosphate reductase